MNDKQREDLIFKIGTIRGKANLSARSLSMAIDMNEGYINRLESKKDFLPSGLRLWRCLSRLRLS